MYSAVYIWVNQTTSAATLASGKNGFILFRNNNTSVKYNTFNWITMVSS